MTWEEDVDRVTAAVIFMLNANVWDNDPIEVLHQVELFKHALKAIKCPEIHDGYTLEYKSQSTKNSNWLYEWMIICLLDQKYGKPHPQWTAELQAMTVQQRAAWAIRHYAEGYKENIRRFQYRV